MENELDLFVQNETKKGIRKTVTFYDKEYEDIITHLNRYDIELKVNFSAYIKHLVSESLQRRQEAYIDNIKDKYNDIWKSYEGIQDMIIGIREYLEDNGIIDDYQLTDIIRNTSDIGLNIYKYKYDDMLIELNKLFNCFIKLKNEISLIEKKMKELKSNSMIHFCNGINNSMSLLLNSLEIFKNDLK